MPSLFELWRHPQSRRPDPPPVKVDLAAVTRWGTLAWAVAALACGLWWFIAKTDSLAGPAMGLWISLAGVALGFLAMAWVRANPKAGR